MQAVSSDFYHRFQEAGNTVDWLSLVISVRSDKHEMCSICWESMWDPATFGERSVYTACKHHFHKDCLAEWKRYASAPTCPMCRGSLAEAM